MAEPAEPRMSVTIRDFAGLVSNVDPFDAPDGAAVVQENCTAVPRGELVVRKGLREVTFDN